jgi:hypothetical protein
MMEIKIFNSKVMSPETGFFYGRHLEFFNQFCKILLWNKIWQTVI